MGSQPFSEEGDIQQEGRASSHGKATLEQVHHILHVVPLVPLLLHLIHLRMPSWLHHTAVYL